MGHKVAIIGLGYVGLPLAVATAEKYPVVGFDINAKRIEELRNGIDRTGEIEPEAFNAELDLQFTAKEENLASANFYIVTVPTPIDKNNNPDLSLLKSASQLIGKYLKSGDIVVYESTVFPGCTEDECVPVLEQYSGLKFNTDFYCGYSPERINPGDKDRGVKDILKVTSGSTLEIAEQVNQFYASIITAGTHKASSIKVAEAAKVIENAQRDINIAFVNELALIFNRIGIDTHEVLAAAATKWNFLPFKPGLVGGHCIGVDPYYLTHKAESVGYLPEVILAGRRINDNMGKHVANEVVKHMAKKGLEIVQANVLILGLTFKENCPDIRNTRVLDIADELTQYNVNVHIHDPLADTEEVKAEYGYELEGEITSGYSAYILAVAHDEFQSIDWKKLKTNAVIYDVKGILSREISDGSL
ncbi:nucleotide sugar dehydrogenase [Reichenbachiella carrageenanivorans]|uniref:Nucleotide sugar dehydrogenase n=1 Tax=Reichenbachiella carrageenanivorans TaxID=2979869 RepID=A0ABY6D374_9BACT|nr:nucleotide sugar dehydrogenase [Reichenbachiella carrageenanivorans]UXX80616.1 nucleotide sugar dehydrogenase [Reichenbachiella carrageenanivorans]